MGKMSWNFNTDLNEYWISEASTWIANNYAEGLIQEYIDGNRDWKEIVERMHERDSGFDITILTEAELVNACRDAIDKEMWEGVMVRAYALMVNSQDYYPATYWAYNQNPVAITRTNFTPVLKKAREKAKK